MAHLKGTETEKNLLKAFAGESQARNRYTYFSAQAKKEGFIQISNIFLETAENEREHAKRFFKFLEGGDVEITATFPAGVVGTTYENLLEGAAGEHLEVNVLYPEFARVARAEGFEIIAKVFEAVIVAETQHERRYRALAANVKNGKVFQKDAPARWRCGNCGYIHEGDHAPDCCDACTHPKAHFELLAENW